MGSCCGNSLFDFECRTRDIFGHPVTGHLRAPVSYSPIKVNLKETEDMVYVEAEVPGFEKEDISILLADTTLSISAEKKESHEHNEGYIYRESSQTKLQRSVLLPFEVDAEKIKAYYNAGILRIDIPKNPGLQPGTEIEIN